MLNHYSNNRFIGTVTNLFNKDKKETVRLQTLPGYIRTVQCVSKHLVVMIKATQSHSNKIMTAKEVEVLLISITPWVQERLLNLNEKGAENTAKELYLALVTFLETKALWH